MATTRERLERKAARRREWAAKREAKADASFQRAHDLAQMLPLGQPILVGHHSERAHRRHLAKIDSAGFAGLDHSRKAAKHDRAASGIEDQLERSIFDDDSDALDQLREKLARLEAEREEIKAFNASVRKAKGDKDKLVAILDAASPSIRSMFASVGRAMGHYYRVELKGLPPYALSNLGGNISRVKERIASLEKQQAPGFQETPRLLSLKYAGVCRDCGRALERGTVARYFKLAKEIACAEACK